MHTIKKIVVSYIKLSNRIEVFPRIGMLYQKAFGGRAVADPLPRGAYSASPDLYLRAGDGEEWEERDGGRNGRREGR